MKYPKYITVIRDGKRGSHMNLSRCGTYYETAGWSIDVIYIKTVDGKFFITGFMDHLEGCRLEPISKYIYNKDEWGVRANYRYKGDK